MRAFKNLKIGTKIIFQILSVLLVIMLAAFSYIIFTTRNNSINDANLNVSAVAQKNASIISAILEDSLNLAKTVAHGMQGYQDLPAESRRDFYNSMMKSVLLENQSILGIWSCWEPNALDGLDEQFAYAEGSDSSGRFIPYWVWTDQTPQLLALADYNVPGAGDYYLLAKNSGAQTLLEPYEYEIDGENVLLTTIAVPIKNQSGRVVGVTGVDLALSDLQSIAFDNGRYESAYVFVVSNSGNIIIHKDAEYIGKNLLDISGPGDSSAVKQELGAVQSGAEYSSNGVLSGTNIEISKTYTPVQVGQTDTPWATGLVLNMDDVLAESNRTTAILIIILVLALLIIAAVLFFTIRATVSRPISKMVSVANTIAQGELNIEITSDSSDEVGTLAASFKKMADNLNNVLSNINAASDQVASGSKVLSHSSQALAQGATEQASSIEELTAAIDQVASQTNLNAENARQANSLAESTKISVQRCNDEMREMLGAMEEINESSDNIFKIIKTIDEIAFQTNILALNAAVEAARAGQHGKGFAVVAEEVRNLSARSANAAKETADIIRGSMEKMVTGTKIANHTFQALNSIAAESERVSGLVNDIAVASTEQALGIKQINQAILQVSSVVQSNSATAEEGAASSEELSGQAALLSEQVCKFSLKKSTLPEDQELPPEIRRMLETLPLKKRTKQERF